MIFFDFSLKRKEKSKNSQRKSLKIKIYKNSIKLFKNHLLEASKVNKKSIKGFKSHLLEANKKSIKGFKSHLLEANKTVHVYAQVHSSIYICIYIYTRSHFGSSNQVLTLQISPCNGSAGAAMPMLWHKVHGDRAGRGSDAEDNVRCVEENT